MQTVCFHVVCILLQSVTSVNIFSLFHRWTTCLYDDVILQEMWNTKVKNCSYCKLFLYVKLSSINYLGMWHFTLYDLLSDFTLYHLPVTHDQREHIFTRALVNHMLVFCHAMMDIQNTTVTNCHNSMFLWPSSEPIIQLKLIIQNMFILLLFTTKQFDYRVYKVFTDLPQTQWSWPTTSVSRVSSAVWSDSGHFHMWFEK